MFTSLRKYLVAAVAVWLAGCAGDGGPLVLSASHQWPLGDIRDEMVQIIAREVTAADVGLEMRVYPGEALLKARDQWAALVAGRVDLISLPLDYASGRHPQFSATLMPGLVKGHAHARRLNDSPFMEEVHRIIDSAGAIVLADAWVAGGFVSTRGCIADPEDIRGQVTRAAGPMFERMLAAAGASITSMPSSEIYTALQTGVLDAANTSSGSFISYRIYEQVQCFTAPGETALWFMYEPVMMSKRTWERLNDDQRAALRAAAATAEEFFDAAGAAQDTEAEKIFADAGVQVVHLSESQLQAWRAIAAESSYATFAAQVEGGRELLDLALAVQ
jgi:TRAP-type C4-dicarboxylate transport system substrate-binding protein